MAVPGYMLDTTVFNWLLRDKLDADQMQGRGLLYATHIQIDELAATPDSGKRAKLLAIFRDVDTCQVPTESLVWDVSIWDGSKWGADDGLFERLQSSLDQRNKAKPNNARDILIAETALRLNFVLVTNDADLAAVFREFGGLALTLSEFLALPPLAAVTAT